MNGNGVNNPSGSSSSQVNGKGKEAVTAATPLLLLGSSSASLSKNNVSDYESEKDSEGSDNNGSDDEEVTSWIPWFCSLKGHKFYCEVDHAYIKDDSNLCELSNLVPHYVYALDEILDILKPEKATESYVPRVFGFKVHKPKNQDD